MPPQIWPEPDFLNFAVLGAAGWGPKGVPDNADFFQSCVHPRTVFLPNLSFPARLEASQSALRGAG